MGCKNFLEIIYKNNIDVKFFNAASSEMYGKLNKKDKSQYSQKAIKSIWISQKEII